MTTLLSSPMRSSYVAAMEAVTEKCVVCSPYITISAMQLFVSILERKQIEDKVNVLVLVNASAENLASSSTDIDALLYLSDCVRHVNIVHLPRLNAKVFIAPPSLAIVSSANFTNGGLSGNLEYGVLFDDKTTVEVIDTDIRAYARLGGALSSEQLNELKRCTGVLKVAIREDKRRLSAVIRAATTDIESEITERLILAQVCGKSPNAIFSDSILYLLTHGPLTTAELHEQIRNIHPDLCDDSKDRIIEGRHYGRLWKHQVRTAQAHLKAKQLIVNDSQTGMWYRTGLPGS